MAELPKAVKDAAAKADELAKSLAENIEEEDDEFENEEVIEEDETEDSEPEESTLDEDNDEEVETEQPEVADVDWEQQYKVLQGKYNAEVPRLSQQVRDLRVQADRAVTTKKEISEVAEEFDLNPEDFEDYGEEFTKLVKAFKGLEGRNKQLEQLASNFTASSQRRDSEHFETIMDTQCPDWRALNNNANLIEWLQEEEGITGQPRQAFLNQAAQSLDANKVAIIFNKFKKEFAIPTAKNKKPTNLAREVTPNTTSTSGAVPTSKAKKVWTRKEIADFYRNKSDRKIDPKKAARMEKDIFLANQEGRIAA